jgi:hypothetical protein
MSQEKDKEKVIVTKKSFFSRKTLYSIDPVALRDYLKKEKKENEFTIEKDKENKFTIKKDGFLFEITQETTGKYNLSVQDNKANISPKAVFPALESRTWSQAISTKAKGFAVGAACIGSDPFNNPREGLLSTLLVGLAAIPGAGVLLGAAYIGTKAFQDSQGSLSNRCMKTLGAVAPYVTACMISGGLSPLVSAAWIAGSRITERGEKIRAQYPEQKIGDIVRSEYDKTRDIIASMRGSQEQVKEPKPAPQKGTALQTIAIEVNKLITPGLAHQNNASQMERSQKLLEELKKIQKTIKKASNTVQEKTGAVIVKIVNSNTRI